MKTYNIKPSEICIAGETMSVINLGEDGRGRELKRIPCPMEFQYLEPNQMPPDAKVKPRPKLMASTSDSGWVARITTKGAYIRGANGNVSAPSEFVSQITIIAKGNGAFGDAGRIGTWRDYLISTFLEEFWVRVKPSRGDAYILLFRGGEVTALSWDKAELLDLDLQGATPTRRGELVAL